MGLIPRGLPRAVIPAKAGIQEFKLDAGSSPALHLIPRSLLRGSSFVALFLFTFFSPAYAELKTFIMEYTYQAGEYDDKVTCRILALEQVKRLLLQESGTYLESETDVKNFKIAKDQIKTLTAGIVRAEIVDERWDGENLKFWIEARMTADPEQVVK